MIFKTFEREAKRQLTALALEEPSVSRDAPPITAAMTAAVRPINDKAETASAATS